MTRGIAADLTGLIRGHLLIKRRNGSDPQSNALWLCICDCGKKVSIRAGYLRKGKQEYCSKQCPLYVATLRIDLTGQRFGRLVALKHAGFRPGSNIAVWSFRCDCGTVIKRKHDGVRSGHTSSCGCYDREVRLKRQIPGGSKTLEYHRVAHRKWASKNPEKVIANALRRTKAKRLRIPKWLTQEHWAEIKAFYVEARRLTEVTGIMHHVDHIHALRGKTLSGLHVPWNLQILPKEENLRKANKLPSV